MALDVFGAQTALSAQGAGAVGYGVTDVDNPTTSIAFNLTRAPRGQVSGPQPVGSAKQVLALGWRGTTETVLSGTAGTTETCCSAAQTSLPGGGSAHTLVRGLAGPTDGRLIPIAGRLLAVVGSERGVWVAQSDSHGRFAATRRLTGTVDIADIDAIAAAENTTVVGWTTIAGSAGSNHAAIWIARGAANAAPRSARRVISIPSGHSVDEIALAPAPPAFGGASVVWVESWSDSRANFHSVVMTANLTQTPQRRQLSSSRELAAGLTVGGDAVGDEAAAWKSCTSADACALRAALRPAGRPFGSVQRLASTDASEIPAIAVSAVGETLLAWVDSGHVRAASAPVGATRLSSPHTVSNTNYATDLTLTFGAGRTALATWTQGTLGQAVMGAVYVGR